MYMYLCHDPIGSCSLFVFENNIRIIIWNQLSELLVHSGYTAIWQTSGRQRSFRKIRLMLFVDKW